MKLNRFIMIIAYILFLFIIPISVFSFNNDYNPSAFESNIDITPPMPQAENIDMNNITFVDSSTGNSIKNIHLTITMNGKKYQAYIGEKGKYRLANNVKNITIELDDLATDTTDYIFKGELPTKKGEIVIPVIPVGGVSGEITYQNKGVKADIEVMCTSKYGDEKIEVTNAGNYMINNLPVGNCMIVALYNNRKGSVDVTIEKGVMKKINIKLNKYVTSNKETKFIISLIVLIILLLGLYIFKWTYKKSKIKKNKKEVVKNLKDEQNINIMEADVMKLLSKREKEVIKFLAQQTQPVSQKKIIIETQIAKTTISRILKRLSEKKVIKIKSVGRMKRITLSLWFRNSLQKGPKNGPERTGKTI